MIKLIIVTVVCATVLFLAQIIGVTYFDLNPLIAHILGGSAAMALPIFISIIVFRSEKMGKFKRTLLLILLIIPSLLFSYLNLSFVGYEKIKMVLVYCMLVILLVPRSKGEIETVETSNKEH
ncbi:MAG: hypothetical protein AAF423_07055 [Pseudomonadota bacterium]